MKNLFTKAEDHLLKLNPKTLTFSFNIDGTPVTNSGGPQFWPILGNIVNIFKPPEVFVVGIYSGTSKPNDRNIFLSKFVDELKFLSENGFEWKSHIYNVQIKAFVCDAPALAYIKGVKCHGGYSCCTKCFIKGESIQTENTHKVVYTEMDCPLRTDSLFRLRETPDGAPDIDHHKGTVSILQKLPNDMIKNFRLIKCT